MAVYKYIQKAFRQVGKTSIKQKLPELRREDSIVKLDVPTNLARAKALGYKAKKGIFVARVKLRQTRRLRPKPHGGRRTKAQRRKMVLDITFQHVAELRAAKKFPNFEVLNSYKLIDDSKHKWYEVILFNPKSPEVMNDPQFRGLTSQKNRAFRGLTSSSVKSRGLRASGTGSENMRKKLNDKVSYKKKIWRINHPRRWVTYRR